MNTFGEWFRSIDGTWKGQKPRIFYRGINPDDTRRIRTGLESWDDLFFVADNPESAKAYGSKIITITAKPEAKILYQGTKEFRSIAKDIPKNTNLLTFCDLVAKKAKQMGYDAVWFERQTDVGTAILNKVKFE